MAATGDRESAIRHLARPPSGIKYRSLDWDGRPMTEQMPDVATRADGLASG